MLTPVPPTDCMVARAAVSARLDAELPELDEARLDQHLRDCVECRIFAGEIATVAARLRGADLEQPAAAMFTPRRHRRVPVVRLQAAAATVALVAVATGSFFALGRAVGSHGSPAATVTAAAGAATGNILSLRADTAEQHLSQMIRGLAPGDSLRSGRVIAV